MNIKDSHQFRLFDTSPQIDFKLAISLSAFSNANAAERGAIFTRSEVVNFILDLTGYLPSKNLHKYRLLEPSFGNGDFLIPAVQRLLNSLHRLDIHPDIQLLKESICAVEINPESFRKTKNQLKNILMEEGFSLNETEELLNNWLIQGDFLLTDFSAAFTHIVGNPPYIRQEKVPITLMKEYRRRFETIYDRADLYVPFIEHSLKILNQGGILGFICSDRWMKNRYGKVLRKMISQNFHLRAYVDMVSTQSFHNSVMAYPAITIIANEPSGPTSLMKRPNVKSANLQHLAQKISAKTVDKDIKMLSIAENGDPWTFDNCEALKLIRRLEKQYPDLEEAGCKIGIGVATGADRVYIAPFVHLDVENECKLKLVTTRDIRDGEIKWNGLGVINTYGTDGQLVNLSHYPKLNHYLEKHKAIINGRYIAKKNPGTWYKTIDRIHSGLISTPKLLIPDMKGYAQIVYDSGQFYPHHNLYYITSEEWDLKVLQMILLSGIARIFIETYSIKMRGDCLRFQAQYLRRIRIPKWHMIPDTIREHLQRAASQTNSELRLKAVCKLYDLSEEESIFLKRYVN